VRDDEEGEEGEEGIRRRDISSQDNNLRDGSVADVSAKWSRSMLGTNIQGSAGGGGGGGSG
jgi:hypothetical protein